MASLVKSWISGSSTAQAVCGGGKPSSNTCRTSRMVAREYRRAVSSLDFANKVVGTLGCRTPGSTSGTCVGGWKQCRVEGPSNRGGGVMPSHIRRSRCGMLRGRFIKVCSSKTGGLSDSHISSSIVVGATWSSLAALRAERGASLASVRQWELFLAGRTGLLAGLGPGQVSERDTIVCRPRCGSGCWPLERQPPASRSPSSSSHRCFSVVAAAGVVEDATTAAAASASVHSATAEDLSSAGSHGGIEAVLVVESPSKAKTIQKYLGNSYIVLPTYGHVRAVAKSGDAVRPSDEFAIDWVVKPWKHLVDLLRLLGTVKRLVLATDPDREGEAISWHVVEILKASGASLKDIQVQRVTFYEITRRAVLEAVKNPRQLSQELVSAYLARCALDYLMGYQLSPVLWRKVPGSKSAGRVQSVSLRMVCEKEEEIMTFVSQEYWTVDALLANGDGSVFPAKLTHLYGEKLDLSGGGGAAGGGAGRKISSEEEARKAVELIEASELRVAGVKKQQVKRNPAPPYTTSTLQQDASAKLGFSALKTMTIAQKLYEGVDMGKGETFGLVTYVRTDGVQVSNEAVTEIRSYLEATYGALYVPEKPRVFKTKLKNAQEAHEAIRPTNFELEPSKLKSVLDRDALRLYSMIWKRAIASQAEASVHEQVTIDIDGLSGGGGGSSEADVRLRATGSRLIFPGYLATYSNNGIGKQQSQEEDEEEEGELGLEGGSGSTGTSSNNSSVVLDLPEVTNGERVLQNKLDTVQHFTQPPSRFTEGTLIKKLEEAGIGRPSTYATIMKVLRIRNYVQAHGGKLFPTSRGLLVASFLSNYFERYVDYGFTAGLEAQLDDVSAGQVGYRDVLSSFWSPFRETVSETMNIPLGEVLAKLEEVMDEVLFPTSAMTSTADSQSDAAAADSDGLDSSSGMNDQRRKCPKCLEGKLTLRLSSYGAFLGCNRYPKCRHVGTIKVDVRRRGEDSEFQPRVLGVDPKTGLEASCRKGPFGFYLQLSPAAKSQASTSAVVDDDDEGAGAEGEVPEETAEKVVVKRVPLRKFFRPEEITLETALCLLDCPRKLGMDDSRDTAVWLSTGRFGFYVESKHKRARLPPEVDPVTVSLDVAMVLLEVEGKPKLNRTKGGGRGSVTDSEEETGPDNTPMFDEGNVGTVDGKGKLKYGSIGKGRRYTEDGSEKRRRGRPAAVVGKGGRRRRGTRGSISEKEGGEPRRTGLTMPLPLSSELSSFVGGATMMSRAEVLKRVWVHIKENELQDRNSPKVVKFDETLQALFGTDAGVMVHIPRLLKPHFVGQGEPGSLPSSEEQQVDKSDELISSRG